MAPFVRRVNADGPRAGRTAEAEAASQQAERLLQLRERFTRLHLDAMDRPGDAQLRRELAQTATDLGREDLARMWRQAAEALESGVASAPSSAPSATP